MRFLQTEWHRHERDRNAWEIERAEMKSRIARLEGEARTAKRLHDSLGKHVKILEIALTREREKVKSLNKGEKVDVQRNPRDVAREELKAMGKGLLVHFIPKSITDTYQNLLSRACDYWILTLSKRIRSTKDCGKMLKGKNPGPI
jgi:adenylosuccinate lyase